MQVGSFWAHSVTFRQCGLPRIRLATALITTLVFGCGESSHANNGTGGVNAADATASGGSVSLSTELSAGAGALPGGMGGTLGGVLASTPAGGAPTTCRILNAPTTPRAIYPLPQGSNLYYLDPDSEGVLLSIVVNSSVRVILIRFDGTTEELLNEAAYRPPWHFDTPTIRTSRHGDTLDVLGSSQANVGLVRKQGSTVRAFELAWTNYMDLDVVAVGSVGSTSVASFVQESGAYTVTNTDIDALLAGSAGNSGSLSEKVTAAATTAGSIGVFPDSDYFNAISNSKALWFTAEIVDPLANCTKTSGSCSAGDSREFLECAWHVEAWNLGSSLSFGSPTATADARPRTYNHTCASQSNRTSGHGDSEMLQRGNWRDHLVAMDAAKSNLALALEEYVGDRDWDLKLFLFDPTGSSLAQGALTGISESPSRWNVSWLATRDNRVWACVDTQCVVIDASGTTSFSTSLPGFVVDDVMAAPDQMTLLGRGEGELSQSIVAATMACATP